MRNRHSLFYPGHPMLDDMVAEFFGNTFGNTKAVEKYPIRNEYVTENGMHIRVSVAGFKKSDINIDLTNDILTVVGKKEKEEVTEERQYFRNDIAERPFTLSYKMLFPVDTVDAEIIDGILHIDVMAATVKEETKAIEIK